MRLTDSNIIIKRPDIVTPKKGSDLVRIIKDEITRIGNDADLNFIDVSHLTDMSYLFKSVANLNVDISLWDVSNVTEFLGMFENTAFNGDIGLWDTRSAINMSRMFNRSSFNRSISLWNVESVKFMSQMFSYSSFNQDISNWNVSNVKDFSRMFEGNCVFNYDLSNWNVKSAINMQRMFYNAKIPHELYLVWKDKGVLDTTKCIVEFMFNYDNFMYNWNTPNASEEHSDDKPNE